MQYHRNQKQAEKFVREIKLALGLGSCMQEVLLLHIMLAFNVLLIQLMES